MPFIDLHCDTPTEMLDNRSLYENEGMLSIAKLRESGVMCQFFAIFVRMSEYASPREGYEYLKAVYRHFLDELDKHSQYISLARSPEEIRKLRDMGKIAGVLCVEEGGVIGEDIGRLDELYDMGVRLITITWNFENSLAYPNSEDKDLMSRGLKPFGRQAVERMEELGMLVDVSHLSDGGFWDIAKMCRKPFIASHSNARALRDHPRNLTDDMLKALANAGGVTGINFFHRFLGYDETGSIEQMVAHAKHIHKVAGIDVLALGSDFDGFEGPCELADCAQLPVLADAFGKAGFSSGEIEKICWKNAMRVIEEVL